MLSTAKTSNPAVKLNASAGVKHRKLFWLLALLMLVIDVLMANLSLGLAYALRYKLTIAPFQELQPWQEYLGIAAIDSLVFPFLFAVRGLYRFRRNPSRIDELQLVFTTVSIASVVSWAVSAFITRDFSHSRGVVLSAWLLAVAFIWLARVLQFKFHSLLMRLGLGNERVLILGTGEMAQAILQKIQGSPEWGYRVLGFLSNRNSPYNQQVQGMPVLGSIGEVGEVAIRHRVSEIIIAEPELSSAQIMDIVNRCNGAASIKVFPDLFRIVSSEVAISDINGLPMINIRDAALRGWRLAIKRTVDVVFSLLVLILLSPLMLLVALLIKLTSPVGPVLYLQERVGLDGKTFHVIKFRSMRTDAEAATGPVWAKDADPRSTKLGRFLRRYSLDELPQFINVLLGDMSIVGPRPERPFFVEQFSQKIPRYGERHRERVGLTGWAQVNGLRGDTSIEERTAYDLWYVENWTLWLDFKIMLRTIGAVFKNSNG